jgi:hypothetical protein
MVAMGFSFVFRKRKAQGKIGRSATTNLLNKGIDQSQGIGWTLWAEWCIIIQPYSTGAPLKIL